MDRMQPPPNYYGQPYPPEQNQQQNYQQPYMGQPMNNPLPPPPIAPRAEKTNKPQEDYEQMVKGSSNDGAVYFTETMNDYRKKNVNIYCTFPDSAKNRDMVFRGRLISAAMDHVVLEDRESGTLYIILGVYINFIEIAK